MVATKRPAKHLVAVFSQDFFPGIPGDSFSFFVEKQDPTLQVVRNDPFLEVIQNFFQSFSTGYELVDAQINAPVGWSCFHWQSAMR